MEYKTHSFRYAEEIFQVDKDFTYLWEEVQEVIRNITDEEIIQTFEEGNRKAKSISEAINVLIKQKLTKKEWQAESEIFADPEYSGSKGVWRLDFAKDTLAIEVAFNHGGNVSWNLIKPILSSELNHVQKAIQTKAGILITATDAMKHAGGFDNAVGTYEKYVEYLKPLNNILTTPLLIIGLEAPKSFKIIQKKVDGKIEGIIEKI